MSAEEEINDGLGPDEDENMEIHDPNDHDVLCGRGGMTNTHQGNAWYRSLVRANRPLYRASPKHRKILVAKKIVHHVLSQAPPCRFLERRHKEGPWYPVPYKRAVDKTSQALRERERLLMEPTMTPQEAAKVSLYVGPSQQQQQPPQPSRSTTTTTTTTSLLLQPQPDYTKTVVKKSGTSFSLHGGASIAPREIALRHAMAPKRQITDSDVDAISSRFWRNNNNCNTTEQQQQQQQQQHPIAPRQQQQQQQQQQLRRQLPSTTTTSSDALAALTEVAANASAAAMESSSTPAPPMRASPTMAVNQFLHGNNTPPSGNKGANGGGGGDDQFADSQDDQFADPDDVPSELPKRGAVAMVDDPTTAKKLKASPPSSLETCKESLATTASAAVKPPSPEASIVRSSYNNVESNNNNTTAAANSTINNASTDEKNNNNSNTNSSFVGALCRVCKKTRFHPFSVPEAHYPETHPELVWPMEKAKSRRAITSVLEHCLSAHPHWPLWNTLSNVQDTFPERPRPANVLHRALVAAAHASPHRLHDTYDSAAVMNYRICKRIGLAEGYVKWGPWWESSKEDALKDAALEMVREYGTILVTAIRDNWSRIDLLSHQERLDLFNNVFVVPYCVDNLRENGDLLPRICPTPN